MYLSKAIIQKLITHNELGITPYDDEHLGEASYEVHLSDELYEVAPENGQFFLGSHPKQKQLTKIELNQNTYQLQPGQFIIGKTIEKIYISENYAGVFDGKASLAQIGLFTHISSTHIDPGVDLHITVEIVNTSSYPILLEVGMKIGQVIFVELRREK